MVLMCFRSGDRWRFCCFSLCLVGTLIPEEHKYLLLIYRSEVTRDINTDPKDLYFCQSSVLCQFSQPWIVVFYFDTYSGILGKMWNYLYLCVLYKMNYINFEKITVIWESICISSIQICLTDHICKLDTSHLIIVFLQTSSEGFIWGKMVVTSQQRRYPRPAKTFTKHLYRLILYVYLVCGTCRWHNRNTEKVIPQLKTV